MQPSRFLAIVLTFGFAGCAAQAIDSAPPAVTARAVLSSEKLIFITDDGELRYWPLRNPGIKKSQPFGMLQGISGANAMASKDDTIAVAVTKPPSIVQYNLGTKQQTNIADTNGIPWDLTYDAQGNILTFDRLPGYKANVVAFTAPQFTPTVLSCSLITTTIGFIAADRHGNIFVNTQISSNAVVIEIPKGPNGYEPQNCSTLPLVVSGYAAGLLVDPKTDALVVFSDPDLCAGGDEPEMAIYDKPYGKGKSTLKNFHADNCAGTLRFGPDRNTVFFGGERSEAIVRGKRGGHDGLGIYERSYPKGQREEAYFDSKLGNAFTTIK